MEIPDAFSSHTHKTGRSPHKTLHGQHRFEHWHRDNQMYFITARCRDRYPAFASERAKNVFWDRFDHYTAKYEFFPWVTSLLDNHYHTLGYLRWGRHMGQLMRHLHGSVAKLVNDALASSGEARLVPFWRDERGHDYFDGCLRDTTQCHRTFRYICNQSIRHGVCADPERYPHTRITIPLERGIKRAMELGAFLEGVPYRRYDRRPGKGQ